MNGTIALLDENLPAQLQKIFSNTFRIYTVAEFGWQSKQNGQLLAAMNERGFEFLITADRNLQYQQNIKKYNVRLVVIISNDNRYKTLLPFVPQIERAIIESPNDTWVIHVDVRTTV